MSGIFGNISTNKLLVLSLLSSQGSRANGPPATQPPDPYSYGGVDAYTYDAYGNAYGHDPGYGNSRYSPPPQNDGVGFGAFFQMVLMMKVLNLIKNKKTKSPELDFTIDEDGHVRVTGLPNNPDQTNRYGHGFGSAQEEFDHLPYGFESFNPNNNLIQDTWAKHSRYNITYAPDGTLTYRVEGTATSPTQTPKLQFMLDILETSADVTARHYHQVANVTQPQANGTFDLVSQHTDVMWLDLDGGDKKLVLQFDTDITNSGGAYANNTPRQHYEHVTFIPARPEEDPTHSNKWTLKSTQDSFGMRETLYEGPDEVIYKRVVNTQTNALVQDSFFYPEEKTTIVYNASGKISQILDQEGFDAIMSVDGKSLTLRPNVNNPESPPNINLEGLPLFNIPIQALNKLPPATN
jgi:hypothetical protein